MATRVLVVTGAGATRLLGSRADLPLMSDWADVLCRDLDAAEQELAAAIGLSPGMGAIEFEQALGEFTQFAAAIPGSERLLLHLGSPQINTRESRAQELIQRLRARLDVVNRVLRETMYREFGVAAIDLDKATIACERLITLLKGGDEHVSVVFATTNYDTALELGLDQLGLAPNDGFPRGGWSSSALNADGIVSWESNHGGSIPVLHLHGAVGWYLQEDGRVLRYPGDQPYNETLGIPLFIPPDPLKDPLSNPRFAVIWEQFHEALRGATHVFILGHSLNDRPLVDAIRRFAPADAKVARSTFLDRPTGIEVEMVLPPGEDDHFPDRTVVTVPLRFGPDAVFPGHFGNWPRLTWENWLSPPN